MKSIRTLVIHLFIFAGLLSMGTGCATMTKLKEKVFGTDSPCVLSLHTGTQKPTEDNEMSPVEVALGKIVYIDNPPVINTKHIGAIKIMETPSGTQLQLKLTSHGTFVWTQFTATNAGKTLIVMVDRNYRGWIKAPRLDESGIILLPGPFKTDEAVRIAERLKENNRG